MESFGKGKAKYAKESQKAEEPDSKLQCLEIDNENPLSQIEWKMFGQVIDEVQGLGWFQILPTGQKSSQPYQFNMLHVLPSNKIPVSILPIDLFISNALSYLKKMDKKKRLGAIEDDVGVTKTPREEMEAQANQSGLFMIPEYDFVHCICSLNAGDWADDGLQSVYMKCAEFLRFKSRPDVGMTVMIAPKWMFVCLVTQPYAHTSRGNPVYLDGLSFAGLVTLQITEPTWPATAGLTDQQPTILSAMEKTTFIQSIIPCGEQSENPLTASASVVDNPRSAHSEFRTKEAESNRSINKSQVASVTKSMEK